MAEEGKSRLGKGLAALLGDMADESLIGEKPRDGLRRVPTVMITANPRNPRHEFKDDVLNELVVSIKQKGILQPLLVRTHPVLPGQYELIAGERRWRAAQKAGLNDVPVIIQDVSDQESLELALIENIQRADLNAIDEALAYQQLISEFDYKQEQAAAVVGKSRSYITNMLRILKLPESIQDAIRSDAISAGHAKMLVGQADAEALAQQIINEGWSVRDLELALQNRKNAHSDADDVIGMKSSVKPKKSPDQHELEQRLSRAIGLKVQIIEKGGKGSHVKIFFDQYEEFSHLMERLNAYN